MHVIIAVKLFQWCKNVHLYPGMEILNTQTKTGCSSYLSHIKQTSNHCNGRDPFRCLEEQTIKWFLKREDSLSLAVLVVFEDFALSRFRCGIMHFIITHWKWTSIYSITQQGQDRTRDIYHLLLFLTRPDLPLTQWSVVKHQCPECPDV